MGVHVKVAGAWQEIGADGAGANIGDAYVPFTASGSVVVPKGVTEIDVLCVGSGGGGNYGSAGYGAVPAKFTKPVAAGETLTVVVGGSTAVGATGANSTVTGSFGTVTGPGGASGSPAGKGANGTYVPVWGWFGGNGGTSGYPGGYPGGGNGHDLDGIGAGGPGVPNTGGGGGGAGGGPGAGNGASGFVGIVFRGAVIGSSEPLPWAKVSGGTVTEVTNADGSVDEVHTFTENGTLTVESPGYARVLLVGAGAANANPDNAGRVLEGIHALSSGALPVEVGPQTGVDGFPSRLGSLVTGYASAGASADSATSAGYDPAAPGKATSYYSDITGTRLAYANRTNGGRPGDSANKGIVIVRVQKTAPTVSGVACSGGTVTEYTGDGTNGVAGQKYRVHTFTIDTPDKNLVVAQGGKARILVCGTGGYCGAEAGNGGQVIEANYDLAPGTLPVVITATAADVGEAVGITGLVMTAQTPRAVSGKATGAGSGYTGVLTDGYTSTITGTAAVYGPVGDLSKFGGGAPAGPASFGARGCVIVRYEIA